MTPNNPLVWTMIQDSLRLTQSIIKKLPEMKKRWANKNRWKIDPNAPKP